MAALEDYPATSQAFTFGQHQRFWSAEIPIGASGATGTIVGPIPIGFTCTKNTTGVYDCTNLPSWIPSVGKGRFYFGLYSPTPTVGSVVVSAYDATAGTMTFKTLSGVTPTQPASGDIVWLFFEGECR